MNIQKFTSISRSMSEQAKKVYECVPISDAWKPAQIMTELHRKNISMNDYRVVMGCINTMIDSGLVIESPKGYFKREPVRDNCDDKPVKAISVNQPKEIVMKNVAMVKKGPIDLLGDFASRLRVLADDVEGIALTIAGQTEKNETETAKLRQLQSILKSLGD